MSNYKPQRQLTVSSFYDGHATRPALRIRGAWLEELGFNAGEKVIVSCENGKLTVELAPKITQTIIE